MRSVGPPTKARSRAGALRSLGTAVVALVAVSCSRSPERSAERFCGELVVHKDDIRSLPTTPDAITGLINLYSRMGEVAPLEIQTSWDNLSTNLKTASTVKIGDAASLQAVADSAYATQRSAEKVAAWASSTCGLDIGPVGGIAPP